MTIEQAYLIHKSRKLADEVTEIIGDMAQQNKRVATLVGEIADIQTQVILKEPRPSVTKKIKEVVAVASKELDCTLEEIAEKLTKLNIQTHE